MPGDRRVAAPRAGSRGVKHVLTADPLGASSTSHAIEAADGQQTTLVRDGKAASRRWTFVMANHLAYQR